MFAELFGRATGAVQGRGGSMHIADPELGILGANGIVAAGLPIAVGAALASRQARHDDVVVAFFGDGAVAQGMFHEAVNLAALWRLPVVFFCENNGYAEFTAAETGHPVPLSVRAAGYGVPYVEVDGTDVWAVADRAAQVVAVRPAHGPVVLEAHTSRWHGHYEGDQQQYRDPAHLASGPGPRPPRGGPATAARARRGRGRDRRGGGGDGGRRAGRRGRRPARPGTRRAPGSATS